MTRFLTMYVFDPLMNMAQVIMKGQKFQSGAAAISSGAFKSSLAKNLKGRNFQSLGARNLVDKVGNLHKH